MPSAAYSPHIHLQEDSRCAHTLAAIVPAARRHLLAFNAEDFPYRVIKNEKLKFTLYEADAKKGLYRGTRFDHAAVFGNVEFAGHTIFGPWKDTHDPMNHDDIVGPCEEFGIDSPLGYDDAKVGGTFLKIGVGELEKPKEAKYSFANKYKVVKPLEWNRSEPRESEWHCRTAWLAVTELADRAAGERLRLLPAPKNRCSSP